MKLTKWLMMLLLTISVPMTLTGCGGGEDNAAATGEDEPAEELSEEEEAGEEEAVNNGVGIGEDEES